MALVIVLLAFLCLLESAISANLGQRTSAQRQALEKYESLAQISKSFRVRPPLMPRSWEVRANKRERCAITTDHNPVCGTDGETYYNPSQALCSGVLVARFGRCHENPTSKKTTLKAKKSQQRAKKTSPPAPCLVTDELNPVCGSDGLTYNNPSQAVCSGAIVAYFGPCDDDFNIPQTPRSSSGKRGLKAKKRSQPDLCAITTDHNPVCGSDGLTYYNPSQAICNGVYVSHFGDCFRSHKERATSERRKLKAKKKSSIDCVMTTDYRPVCGSDDLSYYNHSHAECSGVTVVHDGLCEEVAVLNSEIKE